MVKSIFPPILLFLIALAIRVAVIFVWQFDGLYGQDPFAYLHQAVAISQALPARHLPPLDFFWPNGYPLLVAAVMPLVGRIALAGQLTALVCGALLSPLVYLLVQALVDSPTNRRAGLLASLIVAVAGQPVLSSVAVMADMPALFWGTLSVWLTTRAVNARATPFYLAAAGAALGLAIITRWIYGLLVLALAGYLIFQWRRTKTIRWWLSLPAVAAGALVLLPQLWLSLHHPAGLAHRWLMGWRPLNFFMREFDNIDGHYHYLLPPGIFYAQPAGHPAYIFPLLGLAGVWGGWQLWRARRWDALILLLGWAGPVYLFLAGIPFQNFRFGLTLYPPLVVLSALGTDHLLTRAEKRGPWSRRLAWSAIGLSLAGMLAWSVPMLDNFLTTQNHSKTIARQVEQALPAHAPVLAFGLTLTLQHYTTLNVLELFYQDDQSLAAWLQHSAPFYLLLDVTNIAEQWPGKIPEHNYNWLKQNATLTTVASFPPYTLFKVDSSRCKEANLLDVYCTSHPAAALCR